VESNQAPEQEQAICVECGFCCDGTLFVHAVLKPGEIGSLPVKIEEQAFTEGGKDFFRLPCGYFTGKCSIYDSRRAYVCGAYRCQLLRDLADSKISFEDALTLVREAVSMRSDLMRHYKRFSGNDSKKYFMQVLKELGKFVKPNADAGHREMDYEVIQARCNIFEALLIKHFRSAEDFDKLMMK